MAGANQVHKLVFPKLFELEPRRCFAIIPGLWCRSFNSHHAVDTNTDVKLAALHSLGALNDARAFPPLLSMVEDDNESVKSNAIKLVTTNRTMKKLL